MGADQPPALLAEPSGIVLWLWFEVAVGLSVVVVDLSALILGLDVDGAPPIPVIVALILGVGCLMLAHQARSYRRTAGWVDVDDCEGKTISPAVQSVSCFQGEAY